MWRRSSARLPMIASAFARYEEGFLARLAALEADANAAAISTYIQEAVDYLAARPEVIDRLQAHAGFWNAVQGSLQASAFVAIARIFDKGKDCHTAKDLIEYVDEHPGIFARDQLRQRKIAAGLNAEQAQSFVATAHEFRRGDLRTVRNALDVQAAFYKESVAPIRHQVFAHAAKISRYQRDQLFLAVLRRPFEQLVVFPLRLHRCLWRMYYDGARPELSDVTTNIADVMLHLPGESASTWEHLHAAKYAKDFLDWLEGAPLND